MRNNLDLFGDWWIPGFEADKFKGTLKFEPDVKCELVLQGGFSNTSFIINNNQPTILGDTNRGKITLFSCFDKQYSAGGQGHHVRNIFEPMHVLEGEHFIDFDSAVFNEVRLQFFNARNWFSFSGIPKPSMLDDKTVNLHYEQNDSILFNVEEIFEGEIQFDKSISWNKILTKDFYLKENCTVVLKYRQDTSLPDIFSDIMILNQFFSFVVFEPSYPTMVHFYHPAITKPCNNCKDEHPKPIVLSYLHENTRDGEMPKETGLWLDQLINHSKLAIDEGILISNWFKLYKTAQDPINIILSSLRKKNRFADDKYISVIKAAESYHRQRSPFVEYFENTKYKNDVYKKKIKPFLDAANKKDESNWIQQMLQYGNEVSLRNRIIQLFEYNNDLIKEAKIDRKVIGRIVEYRHYYTHFDKDPDELEITDQELLNLTNLMRGILLATISKELEIEFEAYKDNLKRKIQMY